MGRGTTVAWVATIAVLAIALLAVETGAIGAVVQPSDYEWTEVQAVDDNGTHLDTVDVRLADTGSKRYTGLSDTESLNDSEGMLFTYDSEGSHTYVMRDMDFPIDIVYVAANGTITRIHHAPAPAEGQDGSDLQFPGTGQYVLEVNRGWANETGVDEGDHVCVPEGV